MAERVTLTTTDGIELAAQYYPCEGRKFAILLHMMPATKESWEPWIPALHGAGYNAIAIDERGHGESTMGGTLRYEEFTDGQQQAKIRDVEAAFAYMKDRGAQERGTVAIGASIGANLAIQFLAEHPSVPAAVALSPGLDYRGVRTKPHVASLAPGQKLVIAASKEDVTSHLSVEELAQANPEQIAVYRFDGLGHGTAMTEAEPELIETFIQELP